MIKKIPTKNLSENQWQELRKKFVSEGMVGGSDASTLLGLNPYKSAINMFYQAINPDALPNKMNAPMLHGKLLEDYVAGCWQYYDGTEDGWVTNTLDDNKIKRYRRIRAIIQNTKYPMLFANVDGKIVRHPNRGPEPGILEIKTISGYASDMYEAGIPPSYLIQIQHYMLVTGYSWGEICYLKDGRDLGVITIDEDPAIQQRIIDTATDFYNRVKAAKAKIVETGATTNQECMQVASEFEPDADDTNAFNQFISEKHKARENEVVVSGSSEMEEAAQQYLAAQDSIKYKESKKQLYQNQIKQEMEKLGATVMTLPSGGKITWRKNFLVRL